MSNIILEWEQIDDHHQRAKIYGGWLVKTFENVSHITDVNGHMDGYDWRVSMCFVPDQDHKWENKE